MAREKIEGAPKRRGIQSVGIGLTVLDALARIDGPAQLSAVSQTCGLSLSQTHRYLSSLVGAGMASQDAATGRYDLGPGALRLGLAALSRIDAFDAANTALQAYARVTGRTDCRPRPDQSNRARLGDGVAAGGHLAVGRVAPAPAALGHWPGVPGLPAARPYRCHGRA